eukprot:403334041
MEQQVDKIFVHEGIQLFNESAWTAQNHSNLKIFLLLGLREKEILSAMQTSENDIVKDIENLHIYYPWNTKVIGLYIQYSLDRPQNLSSFLDQTLQTALQQKLLPLQNFLVIVKDHRTVSGAGVSFTSILEQMECYLVNVNANSISNQGKSWDDRRSIRAEFESGDLKREQILNNFFYIQLSTKFEGFDEDLHQKQSYLLDLLENPKTPLLLFKQFGSGGLLQQYQHMSEDFGKKLNIEAKKFIKVQKEKQQSISVVQMELYDLASAQQQLELNGGRCPSYQLEHSQNKNLRKLDLNLLGIFSTSDNLHDQIDLFVKHCKKLLQNNLFKLSQAKNLSFYSYNLRESAILINLLQNYGPSQFHNTQSIKSKDLIEQRSNHVFKFCYDQMSPRFMTQNSLQLKSSTISNSIDSDYDRPVVVHYHGGLMKKNNFEGQQSFKYVVQGEYLYYHYMQDGFNDNGWGCAYRSLQTLISWFKYEGYAPQLEVPTHKQIQEALVALEDKEKNIIGSNQWIGAFEVSLCIQYFLNIESKIMNVQSGLELASKGRELRDHFLNEGSPIMIGGDLYAHTIIGIDFCEENDEVRFLILDPHYPGSDGNIKSIVQKGWCAWKDVTMFKADTFYNLCMPQRPREV